MAVVWLREYDGLVVELPDRHPLCIDAGRVATAADPEWCVLYSRSCGGALVPVALYSHLGVHVDDRGDLWGGFDDLFGRLGGSVEECIDHLRHDPPIPLQHLEVDTT
jgi:hypothetical protein